MASKIELTGGNFQDLEGNELSLGYFMMRLSSDEMVNDSQVCSGIAIKITLDDTGNCVAGQYVWGNDVMTPTNSYYTVTVYSAQGQIVWGPNNQQVTGSGTFDVGSWTPNSVISWSPSVQSLALEVNGTANEDQSLLNLTAGSGITITDEGSGEISFSAVAAVSSGSNVVPRLPWSLNNGGVINFLFNGDSFLEIIPANAIGNTPSSWTISVYLHSGTFTTTQFFLLRTLKGSLTTVDITAITFGGAPDPTFTVAGFHTSDVVNLQIDTLHDYYFVMEVPYPGGGGELTGWSLETAAGDGFIQGGSCNQGSTNLATAWASAIPAIGTALPLGPGDIWLAGWQAA